jgi:homoserine O-succinyltransferase
MPVVVEPTAADACRSPSEPRIGADRHSGTDLDIGLINNMPDGALESTERQFVELLDAAARNAVVRLRLLSLPQVPRSEAGLQYLRNSYCNMAELGSGRLDGLIVTGTEPRTPSLKDEPYWDALAGVADWAEANTVSTVWSCLAAHAAVLHIDGIGQHALADKRFGVFDCAAVSDHPLLAGVPSPLHIAHSRWNELHEEELAARDYAVLTRSAEAGVDMFVKQRKSLFVFFQGHPEYDQGALLREYRRDVTRFLRGQRDDYPGLPRGYVDDHAARALQDFREQAVSHRREELLDRFPAALVERRLRSSGSSAAAQVYGNWLTYLAAQKAKGPRSKSYVVSPHWRRGADTHPVERLG